MLTQTIPTTSADFETLYAEANGDTTRIPWADGRPHPALVTWLNAVAPSIVRCGARVAVVGCGLGDDAREVRRRGYDVTAFDCSATAVEWARSLDPENATCYHVADLFALPTRWRHRFDLVVEINTIQALPPERRADTLKAMSQLLSPHGHLLVICRGSTAPAAYDDGPPWPLMEEELVDAAREADLELDGAATSFLDGETPPVLRIRALFGRGAASPIAEHARR